MRRTVHLLTSIEMQGDDDRTAREVRADVEKQLSAEQANVILLTHTADDLEPSTNTAARRRVEQQARKRTGYLAAAITALMRRDPRIAPYLSSTCPECGQHPTAEDGVHVVLGGAVVIGCEGYWVINPNAVGIPSANWQARELPEAAPSAARHRGQRGAHPSQTVTRPRGLSMAHGTAYLLPQPEDGRTRRDGGDQASQLHRTDPTMNTPCLIGVVDPDIPSTARTRHVRADGHPAHILPTLYLIWSRACERDTAALAQALLAHQWSRLDAHAAHESTIPAATEHPVPGIGVASRTDTDSHLERLPMRGATREGLRWVYLLTPATDTVAIYDSDLTAPVLVHRITASRPPRNAHRPPAGTAPAAEPNASPGACTACGRDQNAGATPPRHHAFDTEENVRNGQTNNVQCRHR